MTISSTTRRWEYAGNDVTVAFAYTARITDEDHLQVTLVDSDGVETLQTITTEYTVSGVSESTGGNVTMVTAPATGETLVINLVVPLKQETRFRNQSAFFQETHEEAFDYQCRVDQQQQDELDRSVKIPKQFTSSDFDPEFPVDITDYASICPVTNSSGDGWDDADNWPSAAGIAAAAAASVDFNSPYAMLNLGLSSSVSANALTIALKQADGSTDPGTGSSAVSVYFRSATATTGSMTARSVTSALSITIPSTATMGHSDALSEFIYVYLLDDAGTLVLAVSSSCHWDEGNVVSSTAITTGADSASTLYSTAAKTNVACRLIGRFLSSQATAGTWASAMTRVEVGNLFKKDNEVTTRTGNFIPKHGVTYGINVTGGSITASLPTPRSGYRFWIKDVAGVGENKCTLARAASEKIENVAADYDLEYHDYAGWTVYSNGTDWFLLQAKQTEPKFAEFKINSSQEIPDTTTGYEAVGFSADTHINPTGYITRSTSTFTFTVAGWYKFTVRLQHVNTDAGATTVHVNMRLQNTTDPSTTLQFEATYLGNTAANDAITYNPCQTMTAQITDIDDAYQLQWVTDSATVTASADGYGTFLIEKM